ncbi:IclR family transcriptional regulator [Nakamurella sp. PAMC28650]|uniref:IclR family transcriptional regulator n=1 Tax=Nakamurella sp. PAMC28650 TaxID=2762325 RepID=UPI00164E98E0|nr:IclR family transcriptional regulator [Nakamurella sp. PAMC28650]QNK82488.1 IclR family transcriptional regulator [Nakamurella sp. PAMC28650]
MSNVESGVEDRGARGAPAVIGPPASAVQSVDRAITALEFLARRGEAGVSEVAAAIGVHKSTASRLLGALQSRGLIEVAGDRGRYRLGYGILRLAGAMGGRLDVTSQGREICEELAEQLGETVNIAVLQGDQVINVYQAHGGGAISVNNWVGRPTPLHATSSGKVLLAYLSRSVQDKLLESGLVRFTALTVTDSRALRRQLAQVHVDGYAITAEEYETGLNAVAAPVFGTHGAAIAAVSLSGPAYRLPVAELATTAGTVMAATARISERMGHLG